MSYYLSLVASRLGAAVREEKVGAQVVDDALDRSVEPRMSLQRPRVVLADAGDDEKGEEKEKGRVEEVVRSHGVLCAETN